MPAGLALEAVGISVVRKDRLILDSVSFTAQPGKLTAIIGPNGAGKTTLMRALSGERPDAGEVLIGGAALYDDPEYWLQQIGYVPVDNVLHLQLGLRQALIYLGQLRLPNCDKAEIEARVDAVLGEFGFESDSDRRKRLDVLSTGERKRANICAELISDPPVLLLDEPTSNLDPDAERFLMVLLARRAHRHGQTIVVITHTLNTIHVCDEVVYIANSTLLAVGPRLAVLQQLEHDHKSTTPSQSEFDRWANTIEEYKTRDRTPTKRRVVLAAKRAEAVQAGLRRRTGGPECAPFDRPPAPKTNWRAQLSTLLQRYHAVRLGDRGSLAGTLLAGITGILFLILPAETFIRPGDSAELSQAITQARQSVYVIALVVALLGLIFTHGEISREFRIYRHERLKGLSPSAYLIAKWLWLVPALGILAPVLLLFFIVIVYRQPLPDFPTPPCCDPVGVVERILRYQVPGLFTTSAPWVILVTLVLGCITSLTIGLLISAVAADSERGVVYLAFVAVFNVVFAGLLRNPKLQELVTVLSYFATGKWAFEGFASTINIYCWLQGWRLEEFNSSGHLLSVWLALIIFTLVAACLTVVALRWRDPWSGPLRNLVRLIIGNAGVTLAIVVVLVVLTCSTVFLREQSRSYHELTFYSDSAAGGTGAVIYGNLRYAPTATRLQRINGTLSQSWCGFDSGGPEGEVIEEEGESIQ